MTIVLRAVSSNSGVANSFRVRKLTALEPGGHRSNGPHLPSNPPLVTVMTLSSNDGLVWPITAEAVRSEKQKKYEVIENILTDVLDLKTENVLMNCSCPGGFIYPIPRRLFMCWGSLSG
jgi:hypothetical protein